MRILPDIHFRENYKKQYNENYEKLKARLDERAEARKSKPPVSADVIRARTIGTIASVIILGSFFIVGGIMVSAFGKKENQIAGLEYAIQQADADIKRYQIINGEAMREQINEILVHVTARQNDYLSESISDEPDIYAARYLNNYDNNWAEGLESLSDPLWRGYVNQACKFDDKAEFLFLLYDSNTPVLIAKVDYSLDQFGNIENLTSVRKLVLS